MGHVMLGDRIEQIFYKAGSYLRILGTKRVTEEASSILRTPQILRASVKNPIVMAIWHPAFVHCWLSAHNFISL